MYLAYAIHKEKLCDSSSSFFVYSKIRRLNYYKNLYSNFVSPCWAAINESERHGRTTSIFRIILSMSSILIQLLPPIECGKCASCGKYGFSTNSTPVEKSINVKVWNILNELPSFSIFIFPIWNTSASVHAHTRCVSKIEQSNHKPMMRVPHLAKIN